MSGWQNSDPAVNHAQRSFISFIYKKKKEQQRFDILQNITGYLLDQHHAKEKTHGKDKTPYTTPAWKTISARDLKKDKGKVQLLQKF